MTMLMRIAAVAETATGLALLLYPPIVVRLLFGADISGAGLVMGRITGISLIALGIACWPGGNTGGSNLPLFGMVAYSTLAALYLAYLALGGEKTGSLQWPAVVLHTTLTVLLVRAWYNDLRKRS